ncbi:MAG: hypothetical protein QOF48_3391 [Verrucomicrobiota bacterium]|jgi:hypothetical protein
MKNTLPAILSLVVSIGLLSGCKQKKEPGATVDSAVSAGQPTSGSMPSEPPFAGGRKTSFGEVTSQLDAGGSLFLYLSTDQWLNGLSKKVTDLRGFVMSMARPQPDEAEMLNRGMDLAASIIKRSGLEQLTGVGMSAAPVAEGLFRNKLILHHANGAGDGFLWTLFGKAPHPLTGENLLPSTTALAFYGDLDVAELLGILERELSQSGIPQVAEAVRAFPQMFEKQTQIRWADLVASLGGEAGVILTLDDSRKVTIPLGGGAADLQIPTPGLILALKVKNDLLYDHISSKLKENPETKITEEAGLKTCAMAIPNPIDLPLQLTVASSGDYFFLASSPELVRTVQQVRKGKVPGAKSSVEFQNLSKYLPSEGNQFSYISKSFGETFALVQQQAIRQSGMKPQDLAMIQKLFGLGMPFYSLAVGAHTANGWQTTSIANQDSAGAVLVLPAVGVTAFAAGLLLPAVAKAKSRAQSISSVSNLKQLGLAARIYAGDHGDKLPPAATWCDAIHENVMSDKPYKAPNDSTPGRCSYAYNAKLSGMPESKVSPETVMFFEADAGWNTSGGIELLVARPRQNGVYVIGLADGSVQQISADRVRKLRWDP